MMRRKVLAVLTAVIAGISTAPALAYAAPAAVTSRPAETAEVDISKLPAFVELNVRHEWQQTGYWCGPAATR
ncbi:hypothetical protein ACFPZ0_28385, partial [Streptomonospora nanhaiensis]|uniref:hypothetical protein n=1 Tax=Streptomonospora nanhaiensis TaxID=1323731 RepID=UPI003620434B